MPAALPPNQVIHAPSGFCTRWVGFAHGGYPVLEKIGLYQFGYENNGMMILPPMALITVGIIIWIQRIKNKNLVESK